MRGRTGLGRQISGPATGVGRRSAPWVPSTTSFASRLMTGTGRSRRGERGSGGLESAGSRRRSGGSRRGSWSGVAASGLGASRLGWAKHGQGRTHEQRPPCHASTGPVRCAVSGDVPACLRRHRPSCPATARRRRGGRRLGMTHGRRLCARDLQRRRCPPLPGPVRRQPLRLVPCALIGRSRAFIGL